MIKYLLHNNFSDDNCKFSNRSTDHNYTCKKCILRDVRISSTSLHLATNCLISRTRENNIVNVFSFKTVITIVKKLCCEFILIL